MAEPWLTSRSSVGPKYFGALALVYFVSCRFLPHQHANRLVSAANATLVFALAVRALADPSVALRDGPPIAPLPAATMECMCAFLAFDSLLGTVRGFESSPLLMLAHHVMGLASEITSLWFGLGAFTTMCVHLAECSTPFLHASWYLSKHQSRGRTRLFIATGGTLVLTFALGRIALPAVLLVTLVRPEARAHWGSHDGVYRFHVAVVATFWLINLFWFSKLLRAAKSAGPAKNAGSAGQSAGKGSDQVMLPGEQVGEAVLNKAVKLKAVTAGYGGAPVARIGVELPSKRRV